ncbi:ABC transporter permease [Oscillospiraceae bacterium OttesenSCG-928-F05]|nr:ABC transporter permease [Oscillospiraceae bacterium OttesenSCG-928-F05]
MVAIFKRDFRAYFTSPLGYVFIAAFVLVCNINFWLTNILGVSADLGFVFNFMSFLLIFTVPILTMRLFSEEMKQKTDQLLLTSPVKVLDVVIGKFLAAMGVFAVAIAFTLIYLLVIAMFQGQPNIRAVLGNYMGVFFLSSAFIAIGLFLSSLTENQLISCITSLVAFLALYLLDSTASAFASNPVVYAILNAISIFRRYNNLYNGVLSLADMVFYVSVAGVFLFLTTRVIERKRWS